MSKRWLVPAGLAAAALIAAGCGSTSNSSNSAGSGGGGGSQGTQAAAGVQVKSAKIGSATVLTDSKGLTLYWFVPDTSTASKCTDKACVTFWPPVKGPVTAGPGVTGTLGTITRPDGSLQATWDGHPLYTFKGDSAPGQNKGDNINANGGLWHEITLTGKPAPQASHSTNSRSGGGSYGY